MPIVMINGQDPVEVGLIRSLARPGGNVTGMVSFASELAGKRLELAKEAVPGLQRIGVMWNAGRSNAASTVDSPLGPARAIVELSLNSVEDGCLDEQIAGPRLIPVPVPDGQSTMFLVFGSGTWTWRELVADPVFAQDLTPVELRSKPWYELDWF